MFRKLFKRKPWEGLVTQLTTIESKVEMFFYWLVALYLPSLVLFIYVGNVVITQKIYTLLFTIFPVLLVPIFYFQSKRLRSKKRLFDLQSVYKNKLVKFFYYIFFQSGFFFFAFVVFTIIASSLNNLFIFSTGKEQSQEITPNPDITFGEIFRQSFHAGWTEEIWRFAFIVCIAVLLKKIFGSTLSLIISVIFSSFVFGWLHSFAYSEHFFSAEITLQLGLSGLSYSLIILLFRRLWIAIGIHTLLDVLAYSHLVKGIDIDAALANNPSLNFISTFGILLLTSIFLLLLLYSNANIKEEEKK